MSEESINKFNDQRLPAKAHADIPRQLFHTSARACCFLNKNSPLAYGGLQQPLLDTKGSRQKCRSLTMKHPGTPLLYGAHTIAPHNLLAMSLPAFFRGWRPKAALLQLRADTCTCLFAKKNSSVCPQKNCAAGNPALPPLVTSSATLTARACCILPKAVLPILRQFCQTPQTVLSTPIPTRHPSQHTSHHVSPEHTALLRAAPIASSGRSVSRKEKGALVKCALMLKQCPHRSSAFIALASPANKKRFNCCA